MKNTKLSNLTFNFQQEKNVFLDTMFYKEKATTSKQLYMANLQKNMHFYTDL